MKSNIDVMINDDYACLTTPNYDFYFGYDFDYDYEKEEELWGLKAKIDNKRYCISYEEMQKYSDCPSQWECDKCLLFGIGLIMELKKQNDIEKYEVKEDE